MEKGWAEQIQVTAIALANLGSKAQPALATLRGRVRPPAPGRRRVSSRSGSSRHRTGDRKARPGRGPGRSEIAALLPGHQRPDAKRWVTGRALRPELEALSKRTGLNPYLKVAIDRLLRMPASGLVNPRPF